MNHRALGAWLLFGSVFVGLVPQVEAVTVEDTFDMTFRWKEWCQSSNPPPQGKFHNFISKNDVTLALTRDPVGDEHVTTLQGKLSGSSGFPTEFTELTMNGLGFLANKSGNKAEFVLNGFHPTDNDVFITMRGHAFLDSNGALTKASGKFIFENKDGSNDTERCFGNGTFVTGKKVEQP